MIYIYINTKDIIKYHNILKLEWYTKTTDDTILLYYNNQEVDTVMVSLDINKFIHLTDSDILKQVELLNN
jgi:uncharacterized protein YlbG (UPF0298 family)